MRGFAVEGIGPKPGGPPELGGRGAVRPGPTGRRTVLGVIAAALPVLLIPLVAFLARSEYPETYPHVPLGALVCDRPLTLHLLDDRSGSTWTTDPMHRRERELAQLAAWDTNGDCDLRVAAASFDNVTPPLPPAPATSDRALRGVAAALPVEGDESSSTLAPTLAQSAAWAAAAPDQHHVAVVATDGEVDLDDTFAQIRKFPGDVVVIALGGPLPDEWKQVAGDVDAVVQLDGQVGLGDVATKVAGAVRQLADVRSQPGGAS